MSDTQPGDLNLNALMPGYEAPSELQLIEWVKLANDNKENSVGEATAEKLIWEFGRRHHLGLEQSRVLTDWIVDGLEVLIARRSVSEAFNLKPRSKHRPKAQRHDIDLAAWVAICESNGAVRARAVEEAADLWHMDVSHVRRLIKAINLSDLNLDADWAAYFRDIGRPLPDFCQGEK